MLAPTVATATVGMQYHIQHRLVSVGDPRIHLGANNDPDP